METKERQKATYDQLLHHAAMNHVPTWKTTKGNKVQAGAPSCGCQAVVCALATAKVGVVLEVLNTTIGIVPQPCVVWALGPPDSINDTSIMCPRQPDHNRILLVVRSTIIFQCLYLVLQEELEGKGCEQRFQ